MLLRLGVLAGALALVLPMVNLGDVARQLAALPFWLLATATLIALLRTALSGLRWMLLTPQAGVLRAWDYVRYALVANSCAIVLPGALGGDFARAALVLHELPQARAGVMVSMVVDRMVGMTSIVLMAVAAILLSPQAPQRAPLLCAAAVALLLLAGAFLAARSAAACRVLCAWAAHTGRVAQRSIAAITAAHAAVVAIGRAPLRVLAALALCVPIHLLWFAVVYLLARQLHLGISFLTAGLATAIVWLITTVPVSLAGLGVRELSYVYILGLYGVAADGATALSLAQFAIMVISALLGIPCMLLRGRARVHP
jgi:uncharacterized membrane protein YbhN (UPF0104 family)